MHLESPADERLCIALCPPNYCTSDTNVESLENLLQIYEDIRVAKLTLESLPSSTSDQKNGSPGQNDCMWD